MNEAKIKEVFSDEAFVKELFTKETPEEVQALLETKGIELSIDEIVKVREILAKKVALAQSGEEYELSDQDLEDVAGGIIDPLSILVATVCIVNVVMIGVGITHNATRGRW